MVCHRMDIRDVDAFGDQKQTILHGNWDFGMGAENRMCEVKPAPNRLQMDA